MPAAASIGVIGAGAWGTALAQVAASGCPDASIILWMRDHRAAEAINRTHANEARLPGVRLSKTVLATTRGEDLSSCPIVLVATPAQTVRQVLLSLSSHLVDDVRLVMTAKGRRAR